MLLHDIKRSKGLKKKSPQIGRWNGSGRWNYSGKWCKGQKSRTGFSLHPGFEWGQTSLFQRLPKKRWFKKYFKSEQKCISLNLGRLEKDERVHDGSEITQEFLVSLWYCTSAEKIKILSTGVCQKKLSFDSTFSFSAPAKEKILHAWWTIKE